MTARTKHAARVRRAWVDMGETSPNGLPHLYGMPVAPCSSDPVMPVLVVPEALVKGCKHEGSMGFSFHRYCQNCGALYDTDKLRWQRPRILRPRRTP